MIMASTVISRSKFLSAHVWCLFAIIGLVAELQHSIADAYYISNVFRQLKSSSHHSLLHRPRVQNIARYQQRNTIRTASKLTSEITEDLTDTATKIKAKSRPKKNNTSHVTDLHHVLDSTDTASPKKKRNTKKPGTLKFQKSDDSTSTQIETASFQRPSHWLDSTDEVIYQEVIMPTHVGTRIINKHHVNITKTRNDDDANATNVHTTSDAILPALFQCTIRGNPLPLRRHRTRRGFVYNPSASSQLSFRSLVLQIIHSIQRHNSSIPLNATTAVPSLSSAINNVECHIPITIPLWDIEQPIAVSIVFRMKRPNSHFIGNKPFAETKKKKSNYHNETSSRLRTSAPKIMCTASMRTDIDNLAKFVLDSLNNVTYADDRQIISLHVIKLYDNDILNQYQGSTTVSIRILHDVDMTKHFLDNQHVQ